MYICKRVIRRSVDIIYSMEALPDNLALVLAELEGPVGDGVEEVAAGEVLGDDAALVDPLVADK